MTPASGHIELPQLRMKPASNSIPYVWTSTVLAQNDPQKALRLEVLPCVMSCSYHGSEVVGEGYGGLSVSVVQGLLVLKQ